MGIPVLILGASGSGKSTSLRNFNENEVGIFNIAKKPLPFKKKLKVRNGVNYVEVKKSLQNQALKTYVIDDSQYLMAFDFFAKVNTPGYEKFTEMAISFYDLVQTVINLPDDCIVYFLHHIEETAEGKTKAKTVGKMIDEKLTLEGLFSIVLLTSANNGKYCFETQSDGFTTAKSPMGMFEKTIDNDLKMVDTIIRDYWDLPPIEINTPHEQTEEKEEKKQVIQNTTEETEQETEQKEKTNKKTINKGE